MDGSDPAQTSVGVLIVEDEPIVLLYLKHVLEGFGYSIVATATSSAEAVDKAAHYRPDLILMDITLPGGVDGIQTAAQIIRSHPAPVVFMTGFSDPETFQRAKQVDPFGYILKPVHEQELHTALELALLRHRRERSLIRAEEWHPLAGRLQMDGFWQWNIVSDQLLFSPRARPVFGLREEQMPATMAAFIERIHPEDRANFKAELEAHLAGRTPLLDVIHRLESVEGGEPWLHTTAALSRNSDGAPTLLSGSFGDITARKQTEQNLVESRRFIQGIMEAAPAILYIYHLLEGKPYYINRQAEQILGESATELMTLDGHKFRRALQLDWPDSRRLQFFREGKHGATHEAELRLQRADGGWRWLFVREMIYEGGQHGAPEQILGVAYDITARKQAELALIQEKEWQTVTLGSISDGVITTDRSGLVYSMNTVARRLLGVSASGLRGMAQLDDLCEFLDERSLQVLPDPIRRTLERGAATEYYRAILRLKLLKGRNEPFVSCTANPLHNDAREIIGAVLVLRDVTEQVRTERELRRIQSLDSLGLLAGGIAHDFNNILTAIQNHISLAQLEEDEQRRQQRMKDAERACQRAHALTQQLLTFAKGGAPVKRTTSLIEVLRDTAEFTLRGSRVVAVYDLPDDAWPADVDPSQLSHVINNLTLNAMQAMPDGGRVHLSLQNLDQSGANPPDPLLPEDYYVRIDVRDEGPGIPADHLDRIFDPYFTTKQRGTGLGLSSCHSIIKRHDGHIRVVSRPGEGAVFSIYIPARPGARVLPRVEEGGVYTGAGRVLVLDDEAEIRETMISILGRLGYEVAVAADGAEAVRLYGEALDQGAPFAVVILDLTIPGGMGGLDAVGEMRNRSAEARFVVSSGYSNDPVIADCLRFGFDAGLAKPFRLKELSALLHALTVRDATSRV